jgi:hypothetical protein
LLLHYESNRMHLPPNVIVLSSSVPIWTAYIFSWFVRFKFRLLSLINVLKISLVRR